MNFKVDSFLNISRLKSFIYHINFKSYDFFLKMATMKRRLLERQQRRYSNLHHHHQLSHRQGFSSSTASSSSSSDQPSLIISHYAIDANNERHVSAAVRRLDADVVGKALDSLCRKLDSSRI